MKHLTIVKPQKLFAMSKEATKDFFHEEIKSINPEKKPLTVETLRTFSGFEKTTDEEAGEIVSTVQQFSELFHEFYLQLEKMKERGEIKDIIAYLTDQEQPQQQTEQINYEPNQQEQNQKQAA